MTTYGLIFFGLLLFFLLTERLKRRGKSLPSPFPQSWRSPMSEICGLLFTAGLGIVIYREFSVSADVFFLCAVVLSFFIPEEQKKK